MEQAVEMPIEARDPLHERNGAESNQADDAESKLFEQYANLYDTDVLFLNGVITAEIANPAVILKREGRRKNVLLIMVTPGGDPNVAFRLARFLQKHFQRFTLFVTGPCKSAGTLVALGAHELVFGDFGELGPLDIQMRKQDDPLRQESGMATLTSLRMLSDEACLQIITLVRKLRIMSDAAISLRTASDLVTNIIVGLYKPIMEQLAPTHVGEMGRALKISEEYGHRLIEKSENLEPHALKKLIEDYPAHNFIIDEQEARTLFKSVRLPNALEQLIVLALGDMALMPLEKEISPYGGNLLFLNHEAPSLSLHEEFAEKPKRQKRASSEKT